MVAITITIPNDKLDEFKLGFLKAYPKPSGITEIEHVKQFIKDGLLREYRLGKRIIAQQTTTPSIDETVVEV